MFPVSTILKCGMLIILINSSIHLFFGIFAGLPHGTLAEALRTSFFRHVVPRSLQNMKKGNVLSFKLGGGWCVRAQPRCTLTGGAGSSIASEFLGYVRQNCSLNDLACALRFTQSSRTVRKSNRGVSNPALRISSSCVIKARR